MEEKTVRQNTLHAINIYVPEKEKYCLPTPVPMTTEQESKKIRDFNLMDNEKLAFIVLLNTFELLEVPDLVRVSQVSKFWNFVASHNTLWNTVKIENCQLSNFKSFHNKLKKHGTQALEISMVKFYPNHSIHVRLHNTFWNKLFKSLTGLRTLKKLAMHYCPTELFPLIAKNIPLLESLFAFVDQGDLDFTHLLQLKNLRELTIKGPEGPIFLVNNEAVKKFHNLKFLSLEAGLNLHEMLRNLPNGLTTLKLGLAIASSGLQMSKTYHFKEVDLRHLSKLTDLKQLELTDDGNNGLSIVNVEFLQTLKNLNSLKLKNVFNIHISDYVPCSLLSLEVDWPHANNDDQSTIDLRSLSKLNSLTKLKLVGSKHGLIIKNACSLQKMNKIKTLSLAEVKNLNKVVEFLPSTLVTLELGNCCSLAIMSLQSIIQTMVNLCNLRLENGSNTFPTVELLNTVSEMSKITNLELDNLQVEGGFEEALSKCKNLKRILIKPNFESLFAYHRTIMGASRLKNSLREFVFIHDFRFLDYMEKINKESIVFRRAKGGQDVTFPLYSPSCFCETKPCSYSIHIIIYPLDILKNEFLSQLLPTTNIHILKTEMAEIKVTWGEMMISDLFY